MTARGLFVTGTDTGVGKTLVAAALVHALARRGLRVAGMKPVASGCLRTPAGLRSEDALCLARHASVPADSELVNPYAFEPAIAPHIAADEAGVRIDLERIARALAKLAGAADWVVVEGVGGWRVPLNEREDVADLARRLRLPVLLVVGVRLGCLNHARLTADAVRQRDLPWAGWVANCIDAALPRLQENLSALAQLLPAPCLGTVPWLTDPATQVSQAASRLALDALVAQPPQA